MERSRKTAEATGLIASRANRGLEELRVGRRGAVALAHGCVGRQGAGQCRGNGGTILRTAAACGGTGAAAPGTAQGGRGSPFSPKALRASAGAGLHLPVVAGMSRTILLTQLKVEGIHTLASCVQDETEGGGASLSPWEVDWGQPIALLVGNEGAGLPEDIGPGAHPPVPIPMATGVHNLKS